MDDLFLRLQAALAGEYSLERELGRGGMGVVYLAREVRLAREVAIKVLPPELATDPAQRDQFFREARTAARLSHPNIVPIHRVDEAGGFVYFVMAYVDGETLAQRIRSRGPLAPHHAARVLREVAWALTYAHASGIIHRDIKPENILLERGTDRALVTDFGIAGATQTDARARDGRITGTAHYASPEQIAGEPLDAASDIYSLGVTGFYALTGRLPFDAPTAREIAALHLNARPPSVSSLAPATPAKLSLVVDRCLSRRPEHRFASASALADAIQLAAEPPREMPAPLRAWLHRRNENAVFRIALVAGAIVPGFLLTPAIRFLLLPAGFATLVTLSGIPHLLRTRRVLSLGYGVDDLRRAVVDYWNHKREETLYELGAEPERTSARNWLLGAAGGALATAGFVGLMNLHPSVGAASGIALSGLVALSAGAISATRFLRLKLNYKIGDLQIAFYRGKWGERFIRIAGLGLRRYRNGAPAALPQLTEVALGRATDALYDALPKATRKQLKALPATVKRLEDNARTLRAEIEKLDASISALDGDARASHSTTLIESPHDTSVRAERDQLRSDLRRLREHAGDQLAATVAALENIRLDLLRLQLGDGHVASVTASLDAALDVANDVRAFADATVDVDRLLADRTSGDLAPA